MIEERKEVGREVQQEGGRKREKQMREFEFFFGFEREYDILNFLEVCKIYLLGERFLVREKNILLFFL